MGEVISNFFGFYVFESISKEEVTKFTRDNKESGLNLVYKNKNLVEASLDNFTNQDYLNFTEKIKVLHPKAFVYALCQGWNFAENFLERGVKYFDDTFPKEFKNKGKLEDKIKVYALQLAAERAENYIDDDPEALLSSDVYDKLEEVDCESDGKQIKKILLKVIKEKNTNPYLFNPNSLTDFGYEEELEEIVMQFEKDILEELEKL